METFNEVYLSDHIFFFFPVLSSKQKPWVISFYFSFFPWQSGHGPNLVSKLCSWLVHAPGEQYLKKRTVKALGVDTTVLRGKVRHRLLGDDPWAWQRKPQGRHEGRQGLGPHLLPDRWVSPDTQSIHLNIPPAHQQPLTAPSAPLTPGSHHGLYRCFPPLSHWVNANQD